MQLNFNQLSVDQMIVEKWLYVQKIIA